MSFPMAHLCIAYSILSSTSQVKNPSQFLLGAIAPDSVHFRDNYESSMKKASHLCVGNERWGEVTNNQEWLQNVISFFHRNKNNENIDFLYGYCAHIITDIQNNIKIWIPFTLANKDERRKGAESIYHQEAYDIDYHLYLQHPHHQEIWGMLEDSVGYDIPGVVVGDEINKMKDSILHNQFSDRKASAIHSNKYVTLIGIERFICEVSQCVKKTLL